MGALFALNREANGSFAPKTVMAAALMATLAFYTRLANFPVALSIAAMAVPLGVPAIAIWRPMRVLRQTSWRLVIGITVTLAVALVLFALHTWYYAGVFSVTYGTSFAINSAWQGDLPISASLQRMGESFMVLLTLNDPPHFSLYSIPLLVAAAAAVAGLAGVKGFRDLPLALVLFFLGCCSIALAIRGIAYSGRYSTHLLGAACALTTLVVAKAVTGVVGRSDR